MFAALLNHLRYLWMVYIRRQPALDQHQRDAEARAAAFIQTVGAQNILIPSSEVPLNPHVKVITVMVIEQRNGVLDRRRYLATNAASSHVRQRLRI
jgi:hypothetical protein